MPVGVVIVCRLNKGSWSEFICIFYKGLTKKPGDDNARPCGISTCRRAGASIGPEWENRLVDDDGVGVMRKKISSRKAFVQWFGWPSAVIVAALTAQGRR